MTEFQASNILKEIRKMNKTFRHIRNAIIWLIVVIVLTFALKASENDMISFGGNSSQIGKRKDGYNRAAPTTEKTNLGNCFNCGYSESWGGEINA